MFRRAPSEASLRAFSTAVSESRRCALSALDLSTPTMTAAVGTTETKVSKRRQSSGLKLNSAVPSDSRTHV